MRGFDKDRALTMFPGMRSVECELDIYAALLTRWQARINLVSNASLANLWTRHFADSWQLVEFGSLAEHWVDLGSGAGFPGLIVALAQKHAGAGHMHAIESDARKVAFLREVSRETGAPVTIHHGRCEDILAEIGATVITSRAMASLEDLLDLSRWNMEKGARALFLKGQDIGSELTQAAISSRYLCSITPSRVDPAGSIVAISER